MRVSSFRWKLEARVIRETMGLESRIGVRLDDGYYLAGCVSKKTRCKSKGRTEAES
jgi:hypothetical protein